MPQKTHTDSKYRRLIRIRKHTFKRINALAVCIFFIAVFTLFSAFISAHTDHSHKYDGAGESCGTCILLVTAESLIKTIFTVIIQAVFAFTGLYAVFHLYNTGTNIDFFNPIRLKVKLNN